MSSANFFSLLEDNASSEPIEIAKKAQQQPKPQPKPEANKDAKDQPKQQQQKKEGAPQGEKSQQRPQTSQEQRGRGRGDRQQRPQTATGGEGGDNRPPRQFNRDGGEGRGRGRGRGDRPPREGGDNRPPRQFNRDGDDNRPPRQFNRDGDDNRPPRQFNRDGDNRPPRQFNRDGGNRDGGASTGSPVDTTTAGGEYHEKRSRPQGGKPHTYDPNAPPRRGRQYDRSVSGTGRGRGLKKGGEGAHNWGKEGDQDVRRGSHPFQDKKGRSEGKVVVKGEDAPVEGVTAPIKEEGDKPETPVEGETKTEGDAKVGESAEKKEEEEVDNTMTFEEYQKQQQEKKKGLLSLKPESVAPATTTPTTATTEKKKKEKVAKAGEPVSIQEFLKDRAEELNKARDNERDRRGGRGGGRGRGNQRPKRQDAPNLKDEKAFPSLSGK